MAVLNSISAGRLRHRAQFERSTETRSAGLGDVVDTWAAVGKRWVRIEPLRGSERFEAEQVRPEITHRVTMRYWSAVAPKMRFTHGGRRYEIDSVIVPEQIQGRAMILMAKERPDG